MNRSDGIKEIDDARWVRDEYGWYNFTVHMENGREVKASLSLRQSYCDRGHIQLLIDGPLYLDEQDSFPRYFFSAEEADKHTRLFLKWRLWKHREYPHTLEGLEK